MRTSILSIKDSVDGSLFILVERLGNISQDNLPSNSLPCEIKQFIEAYAYGLQRLHIQICLTFTKRVCSCFIGACLVIQGFSVRLGEWCVRVQRIEFKGDTLADLSEFPEACMPEQSYARGCDTGGIELRDNDVSFGKTV
jgi:hypothetical protein